MIAGNSMIDGDPGTDPSSPYYEGDDDELQNCYWCGDVYPETDFNYYTKNGNPVCDKCVETLTEEGKDYSKEIKKP